LGTIALYYIGYIIYKLGGMALKKFKLKFLSLIMCLAMALSVLTGCSIFDENKDRDNNKTALVVCGEVVTKGELKNLYASFQSQNPYIFYYYSEDQIMEVFYNSVVANKIILQEAKKMIESNTLIVTDEDYDDVYEKVFDYIYNRVDNEEKNILLAKGAKEEELPERLQTEEKSEETAYKYKGYEFEEVKYKKPEGTQAVEPNMDEKIRELENDYLYKYNTSKDEDDKVYEPIKEEERAVRREAYERVLSDLLLTAKAKGKTMSASAVLKEHIENLYKGYYESMLTTKYQEYINSTAAGTEDGIYKNLFSDAAIAAKYKELLNESTESNIVEDNYIKIITSSDNDSLVLFHYKGQYLYFSVQHILIQYSDEVLDTLKDTLGYDSNKDLTIREYYEAVRAAIVGGDEKIKEMTTNYRDKDGYIVKDSEGNKLTITLGEILEKYDEELAQRLDKLQSSAEYLALDTSARADAEMREKTLLFNEYAWRYSADTGSLVSDKLSGVLGFAISSEDNNHGSFVKEFAEGARKMFEEIAKEGSTIKPGDKIDLVISDYGVHAMMVTSVYNSGNVVDTKGLTDEQIVSKLKSTYVSNLTTQTLYQYVYDAVKDKTVGSSGTYFSDHRNALIKKLTDEGKVEYKNKLSFSELSGR